MQDLAAALGGAQDADPSQYPGGADVGTQGAGDTEGQNDPDASQDVTYQTSLDALDGAEDALKQFIQLDSDHADRAVAATCLQNVIKLKAKNQQDAMSGGGMTSLSRALQGAG